ncbi:growth factor receptor-bound protein 14-like isoform X4 [Vespula squamosa]|uniref:Growth factor receptor-bound protein 14-like isoform X4 n=1 Tax=Vespula squamosa TaxID=30214 RepID=A0ABD2BSX3_VESSQ
MGEWMVLPIAVDMVGSSTKAESTLLTSATREDAGVEVEVGICRSSSYMILPVESCLHRSITDEAVRNSIDRLAGSIIGNHMEELDELDNPRIDRADLLSKRFSKLAGAFRTHLSGKTTGHHGSWLIETRRRCLKMCKEEKEEEKEEKEEEEEEQEEEEEEEDEDDDRNLLLEIAWLKFVSFTDDVTKYPRDGAMEEEKRGWRG